MFTLRRKIGILEMANIGVAKASYYADLSVKKYENEAVKATERIASKKSKSSAGERVSFSNMEERLRFDIATKNGAIRSMSVAQGYLLATAHALDSGKYLLKKLHDLAVEASNSDLTAEELATLDVGAEILGDEFHKHMTTANYKGLRVFQENDHELSIGTGLENGSIQIGVGMIEYDDLYDHINSPENYIETGETYEIIEPLSDDQKETILARTEGLTADSLVVGAQFTVLGISPSADGAGIRANDLWYRDGDGSVPFDTTSVVSHASTFVGGYLDIDITDNAEVSDNFNVISGDGSVGTISINADGVVSYTDLIDGLVKTIEIGEVDATRDGQNGRALRINLYADASIPGTSDVSNGDFSNGNTNWNVFNDAVDFGSTFTVNGHEIPTPSEAVMATATLVDYDNGPGGVNDPQGYIPPNNDDYILNPASSPSFSVTTGANYLNLNTGSFTFDRGRNMIFDLENFANNRTMIVDLEGFANLTDTFSANLTIDFGSWTKSGGTYNFSDNDPGSSISLDFTDKTVNEVVGLIDDITGLSAQLVDTNGDGSSYGVEISSANTGFENGFRISGSGAADDERWTTPSVPASHSYSNSFTQLASELYSANLTIDFGSWTESGGTYTFSDSDPGSSISLDFNEKTVSEVVDLINGISDIGATLVEVGGGSSHNVRISGDREGLQEGFRISGSGAAADERWTTPSEPATHTYSTNFEQLATDDYGGAILHGPAMVSDVFEATEGDFLKLNYRADGFGDWYHVASYLVDSAGNITMALNEYGRQTENPTTDWQAFSVEVPYSDDFQFVFINGTWDQSQGLVAGASMQIDDIRAENPYDITDSAVQQLMRSINYSSSSNDQEYVKDVALEANDGTTTLSDTSRIFNTEFEYKIMIAPTMDLERPVSTGASNNLGSDGSRDPYVIVSKVDEVRDRIDVAKAMVNAQHKVLEEAINSATDVRAEFFWGEDAISNHEAFAETAYFAKQQIMQDSAAAILAQANMNQGGLMQLVNT